MYNAREIEEHFQVGMYKARRVVRTESNYCINQSELKGMKDAGFDEYEFISLGENAEDVCDTCDDLDGERFKISEAAVGVNCPPMHPFCRCKVNTPQETLEDIQADIDRMLEGTSIDEIEQRLDMMIAEQAAVSGENSQELLTTAENGGIIESEEQKRLKEMRDNDNISLEINPEVQDRHYRGTRSYEEFLQKGITESYFYIPQSELQQFLYDNFTKGEILFNNNGTAQEIFDFGKPVAYDTFLNRDTSYVKAKYSKSRTHFSPFSPRLDEE